MLYEQSDKLEKEYGKLLSETFTTIKNFSAKKRPLLAHYTSLEAFEKIMKNENFLLSNPLTMNDTQEIQFGISEGHNLLLELENDTNFINNSLDKELYKSIVDRAISFFNDFNKNIKNSVFVLCFSEYDEKTQPSGNLSMWRGYGANGKGIAIILNSKKYANSNKAPFLIGKIEYASNDKRKKQLKELYGKIFELYLNINQKRSLLNSIAKTIYIATLLFSLLNKHSAFKEEKEWRLIYMPILDKINYFEKNQSYYISNNSIQPKLKLSMQFFIQELNSDNPDKVKLFLPIFRLLLGPSHNSNLAEQATKQMLTKIGKENLIPTLYASQIPYRANTHA